MHRFEIWAPKAKKLALRVSTGNSPAATLPMHAPDDQGWWRLDVSDAAPGSDYGYLIDEGSKPYPDPRSLRQPNGVHGLSRLYDQKAFAWSDKKFQAPPLSSAVIYELHIGTFTPEGTLDAAIGKLNHLVDLGVTHVELMPVASFAGDRGWGYDGVALFAVHEPYGGPDSLKRFVDAAHCMGLSVLLDVVYNHFGPVGNYTGMFGPYLVDAHHTPWGSAVNFEDAGADHVRRFFCDNALMWMRDFHIDGLRLDAVHGFVDRSAIHFLEQLSVEVEVLEATLARRFVLIAESDLNDPRMVTAREAGGLGMDAQWNDDFHHALFSVLNPEAGSGYYIDFGELSQLAKAMEHNFVFDGMYSKYRDRMHGRPTNNLSQHRFVGFIQNHDQVGNRAIGDRLLEIVGIDRARIAAAVVLLGPFVPLLFQGEEWGASTPFQYFADHEEPEMARLVSEGRKREFAAFGWAPSLIPDPEKPETFERSKLKWGEVILGLHAEMMTWYRDLIHLRRSTPSLNDGQPWNTVVRFSQQEKWFTIDRGSVTIHCNLGSEERHVPLPVGKQLAMRSRSDVLANDGQLILAKDSVAILVAKAE
jgi:maltooligosyltrehalose trehalohydrolase